MPGELQKAYIEPLDGSAADRVEFDINPTTFKVTRSINWSSKGGEDGGSDGGQKGVDIPAIEFVSGGPRKISGLQIFVDRYESKGNVQDFVKRLEKLALVDRDTEGAAATPRSPYVMFGWGLETKFKSAITRLDVEYMLFHPDGIPARAKVTIDLQEVPDPKAPQNPSSAGGYGRRSHLVTPGETLDLIAYAELGDAALWPHLAELNNIDDPWSLRAGQRLMVEPPE